MPDYVAHLPPNFEIYEYRAKTSNNSNSAFA